MDFGRAIFEHAGLTDPRGSFWGKPLTNDTSEGLHEGDGPARDRLALQQPCPRATWIWFGQRCARQRPFRCFQWLVGCAYTEHIDRRAMVSMLNLFVPWPSRLVVCNSGGDVARRPATGGGLQCQRHSARGKAPASERPRWPSCTQFCGRGHKHRRHELPQGEALSQYSPFKIF